MMMNFNNHFDLEVYQLETNKFQGHQVENV